MRSPVVEVDAIQQSAYSPYERRARSRALELSRVLRVDPAERCERGYHIVPNRSGTWARDSSGTLADGREKPGRLIPSGGSVAAPAERGVGRIASLRIQVIHFAENDSRVARMHNPLSRRQSHDYR